MSTRRLSESDGALVLWACLAAVVASGPEPRAAQDLPQPARQTSEAAPPAGIPVDTWKMILEQIRASRYDIAPVERADPQESLVSWFARNEAHGLEVSFTQGGVRVSPTASSGCAWHWGLELAGFGHEEETLPVSPAALVVERNRVEYRRGTLVEWYVNEREGVEQGFTLDAPPPGEREGRVAVEMTLRGSLQPLVNDSGTSITLRDEEGTTRLRYGGLRVIDAEGRELAARIDLREDEPGGEPVRLAILVEAAGAAYPVTIDPIITTELTKVIASDAASGDRFGGSVAISGDTMVVGAPYKDDSSGAAYVFERNHGGADSWGEVRKLTASDAVEEDEFGISVAISDDTVVVGAAPEGDGTGSAYVFERNRGGADAWGEVDKLTASGASTGDKFGRSVAISGDTVVVGAYADDHAGTHSGSAYVFERNQGGMDQWGEVRMLTASDAGSGDSFGRHVAISGDTVVVGAHADDHAGTYSGSAYLFERNQGGGENWGEVRKLTASDATDYQAFGASVAISGDTVIVGAFADHHAGPYSGSAYVFERNQGGGDNWGEVRKLTALDADEDEGFGNSVSISGDTVVVGAPADDGGIPDTGSAYQFERNAGGTDNWGEVRKLAASDASTGDRFGTTVAISGATVSVGATWDDDGGSDSGSTYVFSVTPGCGWAERGKLVASDATGEDGFGYSVAISGGTVIVGADGDDDAGTSSGSAYVFERNQGGADSWGEVRKLTASDGATGDRFGYSVAISGDTAVVGARGDDDAGSDSGSAYVYARNWGGADNWGRVRKLTASDADVGDEFGVSVGISGDTVVVGAHHDDTPATWSGSAYVFERNQGGMDSWGEVRKLTAYDAAIADYFGVSVAISGDTLVVGAHHDDDSGPVSGSAYVYERNRGGPDTWGGVSKIVASDGAAFDEFGYAVAISGDSLVVAALYDQDAGSSTGSAYVFVRNQGGANNWGEVRKLTASDAAAWDYFGQSVAISGDTLVVGARGDEDMGSDSGSAYLFERNEGGADNWGEFTKITASDGEADDSFGQSVAISNDTLVVGAYRDDDAGASDAGSAYVFKGLRTEEVRGLAVQGVGPTQVSWVGRGVGIVYDLAGGLVSELRADGGISGAECLDDDATTTYFADTRPNPPTGDAYYYIVREQHLCTGPYGYGTLHEERIPTNDCP